jgi:hypothetical protein
LDPTPVGYALGRNQWFDMLKARGYAVRVYQSDWVDFCRDSPAVDACYTYSLYSPNPIQRTALGTMARLRVLIGKLMLTVPQLSPLTSSEALDRVRVDVRRAPRGVAYIVHLLLPHYGYVYRDDCSLADPAEWDGLELVREEILNSSSERQARYRLYLAQLVCTAGRIRGLFQELRDLGVYDEATIVVHGDHGSRIGEHHFRHLPAAALTERDTLDHYSTLLAVKAPGVVPGIREEPVVLQRLFSEIFFGAAPDSDASADVLVRQGIDDFAPRSLVWPVPAAVRPVEDTLTARAEVGFEDARLRPGL